MLDDAWLGSDVLLQSTTHLKIIFFFLAVWLNADDQYE